MSWIEVMQMKQKDIDDKIKKVKQERLESFDGRETKR